jgi:hypothetical protein
VKQITSLKLIRERGDHDHQLTLWTSNRHLGVVSSSPALSLFLTANPRAKQRDDVSQCSLAICIKKYLKEKEEL